MEHLEDGAGERRVTALLVRFWLEPRETDVAAGPIRGYFRDLETEEEQYFTDPQDIVEYAMRQLSQDVEA